MKDEVKAKLAAASGGLSLFRQDFATAARIARTHA